MTKKVTEDKQNPRETDRRKLPSQQRARENVERILNAAASLLEQKGYDHLTTISIAKEAGASVGSVYQYFPNKHAIMFALFEQWLELDNEILEAVENERHYDSVVDEFLALTEKLVDAYKQQDGQLAIVKLSQNIPELFEVQEKHDKKYARRLTKIIDRYDLKASAEKKLALAGYYTILVDAVSLSIAAETPKRARYKMEFLRNSVRQMFEPYINDEK